MKKICETCESFGKGLGSRLLTCAVCFGDEKRPEWKPFSIFSDKFFAELVSLPEPKGLTVIHKPSGLKTSEDYFHSATITYLLACRKLAPTVAEFEKNCQKIAGELVQQIVKEEEEKMQKHSHYFKDVSHLKTIDVYRVLQLFGVTNPCLQHAIKKLLVAGGRGAGKDTERDIREAGDSINRALQMIAEDDVPKGVHVTAALVRELQQVCGYPMEFCKRALMQANGDIIQARILLDNNKVR